MIDISRINFSALDNPRVLSFLFYPRKDGNSSENPESSVDILIPVEKEIAVGARLHHTDKSAVTILFFHGNGEIVSDYNDLGLMYSGMGINFLPVDYRGYGRSNGVATVTNMMRDCHLIFDYVIGWLKEKGYTGSLIVMGRSLGSASALELAKYYKEQIDGLIIESGFALAIPLLRLLGIDTDSLGITEDNGFENADKIKSFDKPTLIIHAEYDHIIPFGDGELLYEACGSSEKRMIKIPDANHNTIFMHGIKEYLKAVKELAESLKE